MCVFLQVLFIFYLKYTTESVFVFLQKENKLITCLQVVWSLLLTLFGRLDIWTILTWCACLDPCPAAGPRERHQLCGFNPLKHLWVEKPWIQRLLFVSCRSFLRATFFILQIWFWSFHLFIYFCHDIKYLNADDTVIYTSATSAAQKIRHFSNCLPGFTHSPAASGVDFWNTKKKHSLGIYLKLPAKLWQSKNLYALSYGTMIERLFLYKCWEM